MNEDVKKLDKSFKELFTLIGIDPKIEINITDESVNLNMETEESGIIIGYHGDTLEALEMILGFIAGKTLGKPTRVYLEVGNYKKEREEYLKNLAQQVRDQVLSTSEAVSLPNLKAWERKFLHTYFQNDNEVTTQSTGEGKDRVLEVVHK